MLIPIFNIDSAAYELVKLCSELGEANSHCEDNNFTWRIAQLASQTEVFLSLAFSTAGMDMARYQDITLSQDFKIKLHELSRAILRLLHEYRDEAAHE